MTQENTVDLGEPRMDPDSRPWWEAVQQGRLMIRHCLACGNKYFPTRPICPKCWSDSIEWMNCSGRGQVHSVTVMTRAVSTNFVLKPPYMVALIALDEGPRVMSNLVGEGCMNAAIGDRVLMKLSKRTDTLHLPLFELAGPGE